MPKLHIQLLTSSNIYQHSSLASLIIVTLVMLFWVVESYIWTVKAWVNYLLILLRKSKVLRRHYSWQVVFITNFLTVISLKIEISCPEVEDIGSLDLLNSLIYNFNDLHEIRLENPNRLIFSHININSLRNKFEMLQWGNWK